MTVDALLTQRAIARQIVAAGGDYVMPVNDNQPQLREEITAVFVHGSRADETRTVAETVDVGHGRIAQRHLQTSTALAGYSAWPSLAQVFSLERQVIRKKTGRVRQRSSWA